MTIPSINELRSTRAAMAASRGRVVKLALRAGWLMLAGFLFASWRIGEIGDIRAWAPLAAIAVVLAALAIPNWELTLRRGSGDLLLILGVITIGSAMSIMATIPAFASFVLIGYFGVVALMAALASSFGPCCALGEFGSACASADRASCGSNVNPIY